MCTGEALYSDTSWMPGSGPSGAKWRPFPYRVKMGTEKKIIGHRIQAAISLHMTMDEKYDMIACLRGGVYDNKRNKHRKLSGIRQAISRANHGDPMHNTTPHIRTPYPKCLRPELVQIFSFFRFGDICAYTANTA